MAATVWALTFSSRSVNCRRVLRSPLRRRCCRQRRQRSAIRWAPKVVSELPLGGQRKFTFLAPLAPGVVPAEQGARDAAGGGFSANGVRSNGQNNFLLNGVDNNVNVIDFINQTSYVIGPSVEAIGEMRVVTNGYSAEYGRGAGGVVNVTIKSGTNDIHGTVFEFLQNDKFNANTWERNRAGATKALRPPEPVRRGRRWSAHQESNLLVR